MFFACPAGERRIYNGVSRAQYCLARCTDAISEFIQGGHGHRVILLDYRGTNFVYSLYVNLQWFILNGLKQKYKYAAIVCNPLVQLYKHPLANVGICSYFICNDYHVVQSFCLRKNILLHTCKLSLLSGVAGCGRAQRPVFGPWYCTQKKNPPSLACGCGAFPAGYGAVRFGPYGHGSEYGVFLGRGCTVSS